MVRRLHVDKFGFGAFVLNSKMYLNDIGQPLILDRQKTYGPYEQHNGPLLLTTAAFQEHVRPTNWCRQIIGAAGDVARFHKTLTNSNETYKYYALKPYVATECEYKGIHNLLTLIPAGNGASVYYLQNNCVSSLIVDKLCGYLDFIPKAGPSFHRALEKGIDVMYIEDLCYMSEEESDKDSAEIQKENIYALLQLIRPKYVYGLRQDKLPSYLQDLCALKF